MIRLAVALLALLALLPVSVAAQDMHIDVQPDRIVMSDGQFLPRRVDLPNRLVVAAGQSVTLPADATFDVVEVAGTLTSPAGGWTLRVTHLIVLPGGVLNLNAPCGTTGRIMFRDVAIDVSVDPFQWGNGLINFGTRNMSGCLKAQKTTVNGNLAAGAQSVMLSAIPPGWSVGDELLLPDSRQVPYATNGEANPPRRESTVRIAAISGASIMFSKPLDFAHHIIADADAAAVVLPRIVNLTRNYLIENEGATHAHIADVGHDAVRTVQYTENRVFGRTKSLPLNNTTAETIGTNQAGRYSDHSHHSKAGSLSRGNVIVGNGHAGGKWCYVLHRTSDTLSEDDTCVGFSGAGFVTEDGSEVRNTFRRSFAAYMDGDGYVLHGVQVNLLPANRPGDEGACYWLRGLHDQVLDEVEGWNCRYGMVLFNSQRVHGAYPSTPGGPIDSVVGFRPIPAMLRAPVLIGATTGPNLDYWAIRQFNIPDAIFAHAMSSQVSTFAISDTTGVGFSNVTVICGGDRPWLVGGLDIQKAYIEQLTVTGGRIHGCRAGVEGGGGTVDVQISGVSFKGAWRDLNFAGGAVPDGTMTLTNNTHLNQDAWKLSYGPNDPWTPPAPNANLDGCKHKLINYNGTGLNYCLSAPNVGPPPEETCAADGTGNGVDEDGDGQVDEGCKPPPPPEICNGVDDDGDGQIDEGLICWLPVASTTEQNGNQIRICVAGPSGPLCTVPMTVTVP